MFLIPIKLKWTYWIVRVIAVGLMLFSILSIIDERKKYITFLVLNIIGLLMIWFSIAKEKWDKDNPY